MNPIAISPARIVNDIFDLALNNVFYDISSLFSESQVLLKIEGLNPGGSIKVKTAKKLISALRAEGRVRDRTHIIESSSGNLGVALAIVCHQAGIKFTCVVDPNISSHNEAMISLYGGNLLKVVDKDRNGGFLGTRIDTIKRLISLDPDMIWLNQYANVANVAAHYETTAAEIFHPSLPKIDVVYAGTGTTGTVGGIRRYIDEHRLETRLVAVEPYNSVTFKCVEGTRSLPGIGTSRRPEIAEMARPDECRFIAEDRTIATCRLLLNRFGLLLGASTGSVVSALLDDREQNRNKTIVAIAPDMGTGYVESVYKGD